MPKELNMPGELNTMEELMIFFKYFRSTVELINNETMYKSKILTFKDILYCCLYMNGNSSTYSLTNINMSMNDIIDVSDTALKNKRNIFNYKQFKRIADTLLDFIYQNDESPRIVGVDGTYIPLSIELQKDGFATSKKNSYCIALISSLFDVDRKMLINYNLCSDHNERKGLVNQINYLKPNDILIMDRGYYSNELLFFFDEKKIKTIFRMKHNSLLVRELIEKGQESMVKTITGGSKTIKFRIITYKIDNNDYYLGTTILNHTISYFKNLYWKRWCTEINFRESKYLLSLNNIQSKSKNKVYQDVYSHNILFILSSFIKKCIEKGLKNNLFVNGKNLLHLLTSDILFLILYKKLLCLVKKRLVKLCHVYQKR